MSGSCRVESTKSKMSMLAKTSKHGGPTGQTSTSSPQDPTPIVAKSSSSKDLPIEKVPEPRPKPSPYELVKPKAFYGEQASWKGDEDESVMPVGKRWWKTKRHRVQKKKSTLYKVLACFAVALVIVLVCVAVGAYFMIAPRLKPKGKPAAVRDPRLKTKTSVCRKHFSTPECAYEEKKEKSTCNKTACKANMWKLTQSGSVALALIEVDTSMIDATFDFDFADCGYLKWCQNGKCVKSGLSSDKWWPVGDAVFPSDTSGQLRPVPIEGATCLKSFTPLFDQIRDWYYDKCNDSICNDTAVAYGFRVQFQQCDMSEDSNTGIRKTPCSINELPLQHVKCAKCPNYDPKAKAEKYRHMTAKCSTIERKLECFHACAENGSETQYDFVLPDGWRCKEDKGVCMMGWCYDLKE